MVVGGFVAGWRDREDGDDLRYAREDACDGLPRHYRLRVFPHAEAGYVCEDTVLAQTGGQAGGEDDGHEEAEVKAWRDGTEHDGREGEEGEGHDIED